MDYFYLCAKGAWIPNIRNTDQELAYDFMAELKKCSSTNLEDSFESAIQVFRNLMHSKKNYYRYLTYDFGEGGSHKKIYNWVTSDLKRRICQEGAGKADSYRVFPDDVKWKRIESKRKKSKFEVIK